MIAVTEYFVAGPFRDFGPSNFWIAFVVMAAWEGWQWPAAHTVAGSMSGQHIAMLDGTPAAPAVIAVRQLSRFGVLYGLPILVLPFNAAVLAVVWATVGAVIWRAPGRRSPWDLLAGGHPGTCWPARSWSRDSPAEKATRRRRSPRSTISGSIPSGPGTTAGPDG